MPPRDEHLTTRGFVAPELSFVDGARGVATDAGMHTSADGEEDAAIRRDGAMAVDQVFQAGASAVARMAPLQGLRKLHRITDEHDVARAPGHGKDVGKRDLTRLIYDQAVEGARIVPRQAPGGRPTMPGCASSSRSSEDFLDDTAVHAFGARATRHRLEQVPDRLVAVGRDSDALPGAHQIDDRDRADVRLAGPGRSVDRQASSWALLRSRDWYRPEGRHGRG